MSTVQVGDLDGDGAEETAAITFDGVGELAVASGSEEPLTTPLRGAAEGKSFVVGGTDAGGDGDTEIVVVLRESELGLGSTLGMFDIESGEVAQFASQFIIGRGMGSRIHGATCEDGNLVLHTYDEEAGSYDRLVLEVVPGSSLVDSSVQDAETAPAEVGAFRCAGLEYLPDHG